MPNSQETYDKQRDILLDIHTDTRIDNDDFGQLEGLLMFAGTDSNIDAIVKDVMPIINSYPMTEHVSRYTLDDNATAYALITTAIRKYI